MPEIKIMSEEEAKRLHALYMGDQTMSVRLLAEKTGIKDDRITYAFEHYNLPRKKPHDVKLLNEERARELHKIYMDDIGMSVLELSRISGETEAKIRGAFRRLGLPKKNKADIVRASPRRFNIVKPLKLTKAETVSIYRKYMAGESTLTALCRERGVSSSTAVYNFNLYGLSLEGRKPYIYEKENMLTHQQIREIHAEYEACEKSVALICAQHGISPYTMRRAFDEMGLKHGRRKYAVRGIYSDWNRMCDEYERFRAKESTMEEIAEQLDVPVSFLYKKFKAIAKKRRGDNGK